jgi:hypothetical protein
MAVHVEVADDAVTITLSGLDRVAALCHRCTIPIEAVTAARVVPVAEPRASLGWRTGGSYFPGCIATGWYTIKERKGARQLWVVYRDPEVLVIDTTLERPATIVLQTPDRHDIAWFIGERLGRR